MELCHPLASFHDSACEVLRADGLYAVYMPCIEDNNSRRNQLGVQMPVCDKRISVRLHHPVYRAVPVGAVHLALASCLHELLVVDAGEGEA